LAEKHVAVCDHCGREGDLQNPDKLQRWPNRPPEDWFFAGPVRTLTSSEWPPSCFCSKGCLADWASGNPPNIVPGRSYDLREQAS
jgi:hypothetical protein